MIQLAPSVIASTDQSQNRTGMGIQRDERDLCLRSRRDFGFKLLSNLHLLGAQLLDLLVHKLDPGFNCLRRCLLQVRIKRRVNAVRLIVQIAFVELVDQCVAHHVDKIGGVARFHVGRRQLQRHSLGFLRNLSGDGVSVHHRIQYKIPALQGALGMPVRREIAWPLNQSCQQRRLRQSDVFEIFVEISAGSLREPADGE